MVSQFCNLVIERLASQIFSHWDPPLCELSNSSMHIDYFCAKLRTLELSEAQRILIADFIFSEVMLVLEEGPVSTFKAALAALQKIASEVEEVPQGHCELLRSALLSFVRLRQDTKSLAAAFAAICFGSQLFSSPSRSDHIHKDTQSTQSEENDLTVHCVRRLAFAVRTSVAGVALQVESPSECSVLFYRFLASSFTLALKCLEDQLEQNRKICLGTVHDNINTTHFADCARDESSPCGNNLEDDVLARCRMFTEEPESDTEEFTHSAVSLVDFFESMRFFGFNFSPQVQPLWAQCLHRRLREAVVLFSAPPCAEEDEVDTDPEPAGYVAIVPKLKAWSSRVLEPFTRHFFGPSGRPLAEEICGALSDAIYVTVCNGHIANLFDILIDFPESKPSLDDMRTCLGSSRCSQMLASGIVRETRSALATRLHHAGTRTEDMLTVLVATIRSLCVVFPSHDSVGYIYACVNDTLAHLRGRRDVVKCLTLVLTDPSADEGMAKEVMLFTGGDGREDDNANSGDSYALGLAASNKYHRKLNVLEVLVSAVPITAILQSYKGILADQLLAHAPTYRIDEEERVLERMKCVFGEDSLNDCTVMVRDIHKSRRLNENVKERSGVVQRAVPATATAASESKNTEAVEHASVTEEPIALPQYPLVMDIISHRKWPSLNANGLFPKTFTPHPSLAKAFSDYSDLFHRVKPNMRLAMILSRGSVTLTVDQTDQSSGAVRSNLYTLNMLVGSVVLYLNDLCVDGSSNCPRAELTHVRRLLCISDGDAAIVNRQLAAYHPHLLVVTGDQFISLQKYVVTDTVLVEEKAPESNKAPEGISQEQIAVLTKLCKAMLKTAKKGRTLGEIHNSLKALGSFSGAASELRSVLDYLVAQNVLVRAGEAYLLAK